jgi:Holliday junction resolvase RusA-like endonuclease
VLRLTAAQAAKLGVSLTTEEVRARAPRVVVPTAAPQALKGRKAKLKLPPVEGAPLDGPARIVVPGIARPKASVRTDGRGMTVRGYIPTETRRWMQAVAAAARAEMVGRPPHNGPCEFRLEIERQPPASWPKWKREAALRGEVRPTGRSFGDNSNHAKACKDGCLPAPTGGGAILDDSLVTRLVVDKRFGPEDRAIITIVPLSGASAGEG